jgi:hypothetical protein
LSAIAGLGTLGIGLNTKNASGSTPWENILKSLGLSGTASAGTPTGVLPVDQTIPESTTVTDPLDFEPPVKP